MLTEEVSEDPKAWERQAAPAGQRKTGIRVLALVTDAYGGTGGIAQYNRDFFESLASRDSVGEVVVLARVIARALEPRPASVTQLDLSGSSKLRYLARAAAMASAGAKFDLVVCGHINLLPAAWLAARRSRARLIVIVHGIEVWSTGTALQRLMLRSADAVISVSAFTTRKLRSWAGIPEERFFLVPNAIDLTAFTPGPRNPDVRKRFGIGTGPVLLTLGRMDENEKAKGFDEVLETLTSLRSDYPTLTYCIAGDGSDRKRLESKATALGVRDHTVFTGYVDEGVKLELYRLADLFVMPSCGEGFGRVFLESLASGTPVVASSIDGSTEAVRGGAWGAIVDPRNRDEIINAIRHGLNNPKVPDRSELDYFSKKNFRMRLWHALDRTIQ
jgi:glycosyltransferase involved in cell wall biosynthesis